MDRGAGPIGPQRARGVRCAHDLRHHGRVAEPSEIRVFVSYSHESKSHDLKVQAMAAELEEAGFSVFLDTRQEILPTDWSALIEKEFRRADVVLCVCTPTYCERVDGETPGGKGRGVAQEASMLRNEVYDLKMRADRFSVVHIDGTGSDVPTALGGTSTQRFAWPSRCDALVEALSKTATMQRRILDACSVVFGNDIGALQEWAKEFVALGIDEVFDFDNRARRIVRGILKHDVPSKQRGALASLADLVGDDEREPLDAVAKELELGPLPRGKLPRGPTPRRHQAAPPSKPSLVSEAELARYADKADSLHRELPLAGFETRVRVTIELDDLYVPLDAMVDDGPERHRTFSGADQAAVHDKGRVQRHQVKLAEAFGEAKVCNQRGVVLLGDPGSGKTTHLRQVLLKVLRDGSESIGLAAGMVPVFLPLRNLRDRWAGLQGFIQQELQDAQLAMADDFGTRLCERGRVLYLLDGLDEVADAEERAEVAQWIDRARRVDSSCAFLVSCRYAGYSNDARLEQGFLELHLRPMEDAQVEQFVRKWYRVVERASGGDEAQVQHRPGPTPRHRACARAARGADRPGADGGGPGI